LPKRGNFKVGASKFSSGIGFVVHALKKKAITIPNLFCILLIFYHYLRCIQPYFRTDRYDEATKGI
jgi:hypothetical protein